MDGAIRQLGPRERHLHRRENNPLFPPERRIVSSAEREAARQADADDRRAFMADFQVLVNEAATLKGNEESETILALKARLDRAYAQAAALGADMGPVKAGLTRLIEAIMAAIRRGAAGDAAALAELDQEGLARQQQSRLLDYPLVADLMLPDSPVNAEELAPTLLSVTQDELEAALWLFDEEQTAELAAQARALLAATPDAPSSAYERLECIGRAL